MLPVRVYLVREKTTKFVRGIFSSHADAQASIVITANRFSKAVCGELEIVPLLLHGEPTHL